MTQKEMLNRLLVFLAKLIALVTIFIGSVGAIFVANKDIIELLGFATFLLILGFQTIFLILLQILTIIVILTIIRESQGGR